VNEVPANDHLLRSGDSSASEQDILAWLRREYAQPFVGWDFSYLKTRRLFFGAPTWDYSAMLREAMSKSAAVLEVDTGGGERLAQLLEQSGYSGRTFATEGYKPNVEVARRRLEPMGVQVYDVPDTTVLPFSDASFDLVMNRHGACSFPEAYRLLRPGGAYITQQVGNLSNLEILRWLDLPLPQPDALGRLAGAGPVAEQAGFSLVHSGEAFPVTQYTDVGALVYYLKCVPWVVADFSVDGYAQKLLALQRWIGAGEKLNVGFHYYMLAVQKLGGAGVLVP
jgi:SAM-dependent methyltransferase